MAATANNQQEQTVLDFFRILSSGELEAIRNTLHPAAEWRPMVKNIPGAGVHHPRDVIVDEFLAPVRGMFAAGDPKTTVNNILSAGNLVMCESRAVGKLPDGRIYDNQYAWAIELKDGLVWRIREYMDSHYIATLFGGSG
jgi:ketosteroid isomerase-like protein